ncbi:hypothetical protein DGM85_00380 [Xanthomonas phaseoli pv. phaseoli]|nr:hypothetical protein DGM93_22310 [Xanthomonas phaseoli pv. phaseoli]QWN27241.1 hypothetical protein DGM85_00380 [Xanthomonas phaseoli pv. phaseoli]QWN34960.1 hypothetical protein DGM81_22070 [Xanthomonas phaseoli pv. phaseoli]
MARNPKLQTRLSGTMPHSALTGRKVASFRRVAFGTSKFRHFWRFPREFPGLQTHAPHRRQ